MEKSFNCLLLADKEILHPIPILKDKNNKRFLMFGQQTSKQTINLDIITVLLLRKHICEAEGIGNFSNMKLWKLKEVEHDDIKDQNISTEEDIVQKLKGEEMVLTKLFGGYIQDELDGQHFTATNIHFISIITDTPNKRIKLEDEDLSPGLMHKMTTDYLQDLLRPFDEPVSRDNIDRYLDAQLLKKLPSNHYHSHNYPELLDHGEASLLPDICNVVDTVMNSYEEKPGQEMETSYNVNCHIYKMITVVGKYISKCKLEWVRNNIIDEFITTTNKKEVRPDVVVYYKNVLVMIGEEKDVHSKLLTAAKELDDYFSFWNTLAFGDLPIVLGFAAGGTQIQFYYYHVIDASKKPIRVEIGDLLSIGTDVKLNNLKVLQYTINIIRILRTFDQYGVIKTPLLKLFDVIYRPNDCVITITPEKINKSIQKASIKDEKFHKDLYQKILPGLGYYKDIGYKTTKTKIYLTFGPVGYSDIPRSENDLQHAILDILKVVDKLHEHDEKVGVVHRDIRWDNVVKLTDGRWMLIDFEEAAEIGDERTTLRIVASEYENGNDECQASGDIWMIGKLIDDDRIKFSLSEKAQNFRDRLMSKDPNQRPTAAYAINDDWFNGVR